MGMNLLRKIQDQASDVEIPVNQLLISAKILAARLGHEKLKQWVNLELNGYGSEDVLPPYRVLKDLNLVGDYQDHAFGGTRKNIPIPLQSLKPDLKKEFTTHDLREPIGALQELLKGKSTEDPVLSIYADYLKTLNVFPTETCVAARKVLPRSGIVKAVESVRAKLVDLALEIEAVNPKAGEAEIGSEPVPKERVSQIFNVTVMGGQNNIAAGSSDFSQSIRQGVLAGDIASLLKTLKELGVSDEDAKELKEAIAQDGKPNDAKSFGQRVTAWLGKMVTKAAAGAWKVGTSVAVEVLPKLIMKHYGQGEVSEPLS
jgi:hypothetical protein